MIAFARQAWQLLQQTSTGFLRDKVLQLSASLAYYAVFSLGPMLLVVLFVSGFFWQDQALERHLFGEIQDLIGATGSVQIQAILQQATLASTHPLRAALALALLLIAATSMFTEIQDSLNTIWQLRIRPESGWWMLLRTRLVSFALVIGLGFVLVASLALTTLLERVMDRVQAHFPYANGPLVYATNLAVTLLMTTGFFAVLYRVLPDAHIRWRDVAAGAGFAAVLFILGRFGIRFYIRTSNLDSALGTVGSLLVLLVWVYYSSLVLYVGAEFSKCYALAYGDEIRAHKHAMVVQTVQVESKHGNVRVHEQTRDHTQRELQKAKDALDAAHPHQG